MCRLIHIPPLKVLLFMVEVVVIHLSQPTGFSCVQRQSCGAGGNLTDAHEHAQDLLVGGGQEQNHGAAGGKAQGNRVGEDLQRHGNCQHEHVVDHQVDVEHIPAGRGSGMRRTNYQPTLYYLRRQKERRRSHMATAT